MIIQKMHYDTKQKGIAIFISMLTMAVVLAIGIGILDVTTSEFRLAIVQKDSLRALAAADAAVECAFHYDIFSQEFPDPFSVSAASAQTLATTGSWTDTETLSRRLGGNFSGEIFCNGKILLLETRATGTLSPNPNTTLIYETRIRGNDYISFPNACSQISVHKEIRRDNDGDLNPGESTTIIEGNGFNFSDCVPRERRLQRTVELVWGSL